jgi:hypothetical protein
MTLDELINELVDARRHIPGDAKVFLEVNAEYQLDDVLLEMEHGPEPATVTLLGGKLTV